MDRRIVRALVVGAFALGALPLVQPAHAAVPGAAGQAGSAPRVGHESAAAPLWTPMPGSPPPTVTPPYPSAVPLQPPSRPVASEVTATKATLNWTRAPGQPVFRDTVYQLVDGGWRSYQGVAHTTAALTGLAPGTEYTFAVRSNPLPSSGYTPSPLSEPVTFRTLPDSSDTERPTRPGPIEVVGATETRVSLYWPPSTDNEHVAGYDVFVTYTDMVWTHQTSVNGIEITGLRPSGTYRFRVQARDASGNRSPSTDSLQFTLPPGDSEPPTAPGAITASQLTTTSVRLTWAPSRDNVILAAYEVHQVTPTGTRLVATVWQHPPQGPTAMLSGLTPGTSYTYQVRARDDVGNLSAFGPPLTVTTPGAPAATCAVDYRVVSRWGSGFEAAVTVRNTGESAVDGWTLAWTFAGQERVTSAWNATVLRPGPGEASVAGVRWNALLAPGQSATVGFVGARSAALESPTAFTLNGAACTTG